jgi:hypothetical protein
MLLGRKLDECAQRECILVDHARWHETLHAETLERVFRRLELVFIMLAPSVWLGSLWAAPAEDC